MLSPLPRWIGIGGSVTSLSRLGLPRILGGSASTTFLSGPSQGSLALRPARLLQPYRLTSVPRASAGRSPYPTVWVATGMNRQFPGRDLHPLVSYAFVAHQYIVFCHFRIELWIVHDKPILFQRFVLFTFRALIAHTFSAVRFVYIPCLNSTLAVFVDL